MARLRGRPRTQPRAGSIAGTFGERLVKTRELRGLTQSELAVQAGISKSALSRLESFVRGSTEAETVLRLSDVLEVRPEWLWWGREPFEASPAERRLTELRRRLEKSDVEDENLALALKKSRQIYHDGVVVLANALARRGERHTPDGWLARLEEIRERLEPLLPR